MAHGIAGIDHTLIGVKDLEAARAVYRRLGFTLTPRGRHDNWGTGNYCVMFPDDYIELLGIVDPSGYSGGLDRLLAEHGEGLSGIALATRDADLAHQALAASGLAKAAPQSLSRSLELPEGAVRPEFRLVHLTDAAAPLTADPHGAALHMFLCQHLTPALVRRPAWLAHANGARGVTAVTVVAEDPGVLVPAFERLFGPGSTAMTDDTLGVFTDHGAILFVTPDDLHVLYPAAAAGPPPSPPYIAAMRLQVEDPERTASYFDASGVRYWRSAEGSIRVAPADTCGVILEFTR